MLSYFRIRPRFTLPFSSLLSSSSPSSPFPSFRNFGSRLTFTPVPSSPTPDFPQEPENPKVITSTFPGPRSVSLSSSMHTLQESRTTHFFANYSQSRGNYIVDADGNTLLDVFCQISSMPIGYNNPSLLAAARSDKWITSTINRPALGIAPDAEWVESLEKIFMPVAPKGLNNVTTLMCGSCANEVAYKAAFMRYRHKERESQGRGNPMESGYFTPEEMSSCMKNTAPGSADLSILSFTGSFHGRTFGSLSTTRSKDLHKVDIPAFPWPAATFPNIKYPLDDPANQTHNKNEEDKCLKEVEHLINTWPHKVAGLVIEPIAAEGGDNSASPSFYKRLRLLAKQKGVTFIVDEVQTGGGPSGKFWAHEYWGLSESDAPDIVTFSKKLQAAGFYSTSEYRQSHGYRNFNTWLGDPMRALQMGVIVDEINRSKLLENVRITGAYLKENLFKLQKAFPNILSNVRGMGTMLAFDFPTPAIRDEVVGKMRKIGVQSSGCGTRTIRLRPMLIFKPNHGKIYLEKLQETLETIKG